MIVRPSSQSTTQEAGLSMRFAGAARAARAAKLIYSIASADLSTTTMTCSTINIAKTKLKPKYMYANNYVEVKTPRMGHNSFNVSELRAERAAVTKLQHTESEGRYTTKGRPSLQPKVNPALFATNQQGAHTCKAKLQQTGSTKT